MKRKSAPLVVVEVKRARSSSSALADAFDRGQSGKGLWQGVSLKPARPITPSLEPKQPTVSTQKNEKNARSAPRVLPCLTPMYEPSVPEPQEATQDASPSRSPKAERKAGDRRMRSEAARMPVQEGVIVEVPVPSPASVELPAASAPTPTSPMRTILNRTNKSERGQDRPEFRRGERWKRRLPRACW